MKTRLTRWLVTGGVAALTAIGLAAAPALAAPNAPATSNVQTYYSLTQAGHALQGNGSQAYNAVWGEATVPNLTAAIAPNTVAVGVALATSSISAGDTYALALVWGNATCGAGQWTLEANTAAFPVTAPAPEPVPLASLAPLSAHVCVAPGGALWMKIQQSTLHQSISYIVGPSASNNDVVGTVTGIGSRVFLGAGEGATTTTETVAAALPVSPLVAWNTFAVNRLAHHGGGHATGIAVGVSGNGGTANWATYKGTTNGAVTGGPTMTPSGFTLVNFGTVNSIAVP